MPTDTRAMDAIHAVFRSELPALSARVAHVPAGALDRAGVVADHVDLITRLLHVHHESEDLLFWPLLESRDPGDDPSWFAMSHEHEHVALLLSVVERELAAWRRTAASPGPLLAALEQLTAATIAHLDHEEREVVPLLAQWLTQEEFDRLGAHSRAVCTPEELMLAFGMMYDDAGPDLVTHILDHMPPAARDDFIERQLPAYRAYRSRLDEASA